MKMNSAECCIYDAVCYLFIFFNIAASQSDFTIYNTVQACPGDAEVFYIAAWSFSLPARLSASRSVCNHCELDSPVSASPEFSQLSPSPHRVESEAHEPAPEATEGHKEHKNTQTHDSVEIQLEGQLL